MPQIRLTKYLASDKVQEEAGEDANFEEIGLKVQVDTVQSLETNVVDMSAECLNFWFTKFIAEKSCTQLVWEFERTTSGPGQCLARNFLLYSDGAP